jgi:hypothetical protein
MSARSGVLTQTGSTLVERGLYCARPRDYGAILDRSLPHGSASLLRTPDLRCGDRDN